MQSLSLVCEAPLFREREGADRSADRCGLRLHNYFRSTIQVRDVELAIDEPVAVRSLPLPTPSADIA